MRELACESIDSLASSNPQALQHEELEINLKVEYQHILKSKWKTKSGKKLG